MNSLKHLGVPIVAMGTIDEPDEVLRWRGGGVVRSVYLRDDRWSAPSWPVTSGRPGSTTR